MRRWGALGVLTFALAGLLGAVTPLASQTRDENLKRCADPEPVTEALAGESSEDEALVVWLFSRIGKGTLG